MTLTSTPVSASEETMIGRVADAFDPRVSVGAPGRSVLISSKPEEFPVSNSKRKGGGPSFPAGALMIGLSRISGWNVRGVGTGVTLSGHPSLVDPAIRRTHPRIARGSKGADTAFLSQFFFVISSPQTGGSSDSLPALATTALLPSGHAVGARTLSL